MSDRERAVAWFAIVLLLEMLALVVLRLEATENIVRELRSRIGYAAPAWRRVDPDMDGARW